MKQSIWRRKTYFVVLLLIFCTGVVALIGCGDDDDDSFPNAYLRIHNGFQCPDDTQFAMKIRIDGREIWANSGEWSECAAFDPGSYSGPSYFAACGVVLEGQHSIELKANCTYEIRYFLGDDGRPTFEEQQQCPGDC